MKRFLSFAMLLCFFAARIAAGEDVKIPITADNSICCDPTELENNMGAAPRIKMKGNENILVLNFDPTPLKGKLVTKATLHIKATEKNVMVRKVGFSTIAVPWHEGKSEHDIKGAAGDSCMKSSDMGSGKLWAAPGSSFLDVRWGRGGTMDATMAVEPVIEMACFESSAEPSSGWTGGRSCFAWAIYRAMVSRCTPSSREIRLCDQPCPIRVRIISLCAMLS